MEKSDVKQYKKHKIKNYIDVTSIVTIHYFEFTKDYIYDGESHDFWEMVYVDKGEIIATADYTDITLKCGEALFHKPLEFHKLRSNGVSAPNVFVISFVCNDEDMRFFEKKHIIVPTKLRKLITDIIAESQNTYELPVFDRDLKELNLAKNPIFGGTQIIKMRLEELLIKLIRTGFGEIENVGASDFRIRSKAENGKFGSTVAKCGSALPENEDEALPGKIIELIKQDGIYGSINLDRICKEVNYGKTYICTKFKIITGYSVMEYTNILKIAEAKRLIREKKYNFMQISSMLNFNNPHYFSKVFKKITGLSPREYMHTVNK